ncbi:hypothetical protein K4F52_002354 [Lecanicillium sp. MT-2017a]|nr:hypothetical protein K4F52_002354 [Lecanicillium sp. MT-2017a]
MARDVETSPEEVPTTPTETSALLSHHQQPANESSPQPPTHRSSCTWPWLHVVAVCISLAILSDCGETLFAAPRIRFLESIACTRYYTHHDPSLVDRNNGSVPERLCKIDPVQDKVASVMGWQLFFDSIPAILLPDSVGVLDLPLEYAWLSSLFYLIGGGPTTGTAILTTVVADVVPAHLRSTVFFYRFCTDQVADLVVPPIAAVMMAKDTWLPLLVAVGLQLLTVILSLGLPETLPVSDEPVDTDSAADTSSVDSNCGKRTTLLKRAKRSFEFITRDKTVASLVFTFLISKVGRQSSNVLFQYVSKRYDWALSQATLLVSLRAGVNIILFTAVLPALTTFVLASKNAAVKDLRIGKASIVLLALGSLILFASQAAAVMIVGLIVTTLGMGFPPIIRSLVTFLVESHHASQTSDVGRLYAVIAAMEGVGSLVAGPGMAWAFRVGISWGRAWLGLPFAVAAFLFASVSVLVFRVKI